MIFFSFKKKKKTKKREEEEEVRNPAQRYIGHSIPKRK
jgi:hypothetical protein